MWFLEICEGLLGDFFLIVLDWVLAADCKIWVALSVLAVGKDMLILAVGVGLAF